VSGARLLGEDRLLTVLATALRAAREAGAEEAEASYEGGALGVTRFANSYFTQAAEVVEGRARLRVAVGGRLGAAGTTLVDVRGLADAARQAVAIAHHRRAGEPLSGFARPRTDRPPLAPGRYVEATAAVSPAERAARLARVFRRAVADDLLCAGSFSTGPTELGVATTGGVNAYLASTEAHLEVVALDAQASGYGVFYGPDVAALEEGRLAEEACTTAARARTTVEIPPGPLDVVLAPAAVAEALEWMAHTSFTARALLDGASLLAGRDGQTLCGPEVTIRDDPGFDHPQAIPLPFDSEGTVRRAVTFIDRGRAGEVITDLASARKLADRSGRPLTSSGHAPPLVDEMADGPVAANLIMLPGEIPGDQLIARVERGLYVTRFHYVNGYLDPRRAIMTGMTRDGTFLIQDGRLGAAVRNLRFTESFLDALGRLGGVGRELACLPSRTTGIGSVLCPALLIRAFRFTGRTG
jgi:predicted Zn-dependent protease